jgi:hypothetical protein
MNEKTNGELQEFIEAEEFETWTEAYEKCRETGQALTVVVGSEIGIVYPSGAYEHIGEVAEVVEPNGE